jgi:hypothetical protein
LSGLRKNLWRFGLLSYLLCRSGFNYRRSWNNYISVLIGCEVGAVAIIIGRAVDVICGVVVGEAGKIGTYRPRGPIPMAIMAAVSVAVVAVSAQMASS